MSWKFHWWFIINITGYENINIDELNIYFINSDEVNAFVTGGKNIFINTEVIIEADDYREYAAVLAHEIAHILGDIFNTQLIIKSLKQSSTYIYWALILLVQLKQVWPGDGGTSKCDWWIYILLKLKRHLLSICGKNIMQK